MKIEELANKLYSIIQSMLINDFREDIDMISISISKAEIEVIYLREMETFSDERDKKIIRFPCDAYNFECIYGRYWLRNKLTNLLEKKFHDKIAVVRGVGNEIYVLYRISFPLLWIKYLREKIGSEISSVLSKVNRL